MLFGWLLIVRTEIFSAIMHFERQIRVLIVVDSMHRELSSALALSEVLRVDPKIAVELIPRQVLPVAFNLIKPHAILLPKVHKIPFLNEMRRSCRVILMLSESFSGSKSAFETLKGNLDLNSVDHVCCWGQFDRDIYLNLGLAPVEKLSITGGLCSDYWWNFVTINKLATSNKKVGIAMSMRALTHRAYGKRAGSVESILGVIKAGQESGFFDNNSLPEGWIAYEATWLKIVYEICLKNPKTKFSLRPHPLESVENYELFRSFDNVEICSRDTLTEWFSDIDLLLSAFSTSMIDAYMHGVQVISLKPLFDPDILKLIPVYQSEVPFDDLFLQARTYEELESLIASIPVRKSEVTKTRLEAFLKETFNFGEKTKRPSVAVAEVIKKQLISGLSNLREHDDLPLSSWDKYCAVVLRSWRIRVILIRLRALFDRRLNTSSMYVPRMFKRHENS